MAGLEARQRALGDPGRSGQFGQGDAPLRAQTLHARAEPAAPSKHVMTEKAPIQDVVVVGGGAAGLSAALVLGRARRRVAVVDAGAPRNGPAAEMRGFLSCDGMSPADLLAAGRVEVSGYGVELVADQVIGIEDGFVVRLASGRVLKARRILLGTGVRDELPDIPGVKERWGRDLLHCPYCHGWEVRDQPIGVLGTQPGSVQHAQLVRQWFEDVVFFVHTSDLSATEEVQLEARGVRIVRGEIARLLVEDDRLTGVELADGRVIPRTAVFIRPSIVPHTDGLLAGLGCEVDEGGFATVDRTGRTTALGVWAAGNVADPRAQVITAAGAGSAAAIDINADLVQEDVVRTQLRAERLRRSGRFASFVERVEDEVEAILECSCEVVADFGDVSGDNLGEVGEVLRERGELPLVRELGELADLLLRDGCGSLRALEREALFLKGEPVDVGVEDGVGLDGQIDREAGFTEATEDGVVDPETRRPWCGARLHQADGPAVTVEHLAGRDRPPAHRRLPVDVGWRQLDLAEDDVDHPSSSSSLFGT